MPLLHGWRFCPRCRGGLVGDLKRLECAECGFVAYANPATSVCGLCVDEQGRVLLARRANDPDRGKWDVPGGFVEEGEEALDGLWGELREETGLEVEVGDFLGVWADWYGSAPEAAGTLNLYWEVRARSGVAEPADDVSEVRWFAPDDLPPPEEIAFRNVAEVLSAWRRRHQHP